MISVYSLPLERTNVPRRTVCERFLAGYFVPISHSGILKFNDIFTPNLGGGQRPPF